MYLKLDNSLLDFSWSFFIFDFEKTKTAHQKDIENLDTELNNKITKKDNEISELKSLIKDYTSMLDTTRTECEEKSEKIENLEQTLRKYKIDL